MQRHSRDRCDDSAVREGVGTRPWIVDDDLWALIKPLLPPWPKRSPWPKPVDDRRCLQGNLFFLHQDIAWQLLPLTLGFGSGRALTPDVEHVYAAWARVVADGWRSFS
ncbi:transposase [Streptomyces sp. NPDC054952]